MCVCARFTLRMCCSRLAAAGRRVGGSRSVAEACTDGLGGHTQPKPSSVPHRNDSMDEGRRTARRDCFFGFNCRTQSTEHSAALGIICPAVVTTCTPQADVSKTVEHVAAACDPSRLCDIAHVARNDSSIELSVASHQLRGANGALWHIMDMAGAVGPGPRARPAMAPHAVHI